MNFIPAKISNITATQELCLVDFSTYEASMSMVSLHLDEKMTQGKEVLLGVKATAIGLSKRALTECSLSNQLQTEVLCIKKAEILSSITLQFFDTQLESIITTRSLERLKLKEGDSVTALIKASELSIIELRK